MRDAFRALGHEAWSCDLRASRFPSPYHLIGDALEYAYGYPWDMMIAHPPCTEFSGSGARWRSDHWVKSKLAPGGRYWHDGAAKRALQRESLLFVMMLWLAPIPLKALENPRGELSKLLRPPTQYIHPWQFGHPEFKKTGLWLDGLPKLAPTQILTPPERGTPEHDRWSVVHRMVPGPDRARDRAVTYSGWAQAMASQWGNL